MIMSHSHQQTDSYIRSPDLDTAASFGSSYFSQNLLPIYKQEPAESLEESRLAQNPGGADWRVIFRDIQEKRKLEKEQKKLRGESEDEEKEEAKLIDQHESDNARKVQQQQRKQNRRRRRQQGEKQKFGRMRRDFAPDRAYYHEYPDSNRFESDETWRTPEVFSKSNVIIRDIHKNDRLTHDDVKNLHPEVNQQQTLKKVAATQGITKADYIKQELPRDFGYNTERIFLLLKTGYTVQWERIPMHLLTTLTRFPNFGIYSDAASSVGGYEVMDVLADLPESILKNPQLDLYVEQQKSRRGHAQYPAKSFTQNKQNQLNGQAWIMDKFKNLPMLYHAWKSSPDQDWYFMIDDDTFVLADNLGKFLATLDPNKPYYLGSAVAGLNHIFAHGGSGIVLSKGLMKKAFDHPKIEEWLDEYAHRALQECCGDFLLAAFLKEKVDIDLNLAASGRKFQGEPIAKVACHRQNWCSEIVTFHHSSPRDMELLWEYERVRSYYSTNMRDSYVFSPADAPIMLENPSITYGDIYTDFIKPYLKPMRSNWDNNAKEFQFSWLADMRGQKATVDDYLRNDGFSDKPYTSVDQCRQACLGNPDCVMFRYDPFQKYCGYSTSLTLGNAIPVSSAALHGDSEVIKMLKKHGINTPRTQSQGMYSEWRFDRIEAMRSKLACDPEAQQDIPEIDDGKEGWYWHARERFEDVKVD